MDFAKVPIIDESTNLISEALWETAVPVKFGHAVTLCGYRKGIIRIKVTETGTAAVTIDTIQVSHDGGVSFTNVQTGLAQTFSASGFAQVALTGSFGLPTHVKLLVSSVTADADNYFSATVELHVAG